ncbi:hypothetical protein CEXT_702731 [Caerostris extrusa]|uniref:Uncharacterized protein n=1 Tax=Caerostris extrusa TaxID=172846 RepID=A0AAV4Q7F6_CAEEX|nr:hypothetical protein CEXT_702731 [Caerostris extrusa]
MVSTKNLFGSRPLTPSPYLIQKLIQLATIPVWHPNKPFHSTDLIEFQPSPMLERAKRVFLAKKSSLRYCSPRHDFIPFFFSFQEKRGGAEECRRRSISRKFPVIFIFRQRSREKRQSGKAYNLCLLLHPRTPSLQLMASSEADKPTKRTIKKSSETPCARSMHREKERIFPPSLPPYFMNTLFFHAFFLAAPARHGEAPPSGQSSRRPVFLHPV